MLDDPVAVATSLLESLTIEHLESVSVMDQSVF
jgi:hypothetical protein